jgi:glucose-1-phosphate cytidylyltransferase
MKAVILAGGLGTRLSEETSLKPKPMVEIGSMPILWHIMKTYSSYGINDFIICLGYKGYIIKEYFSNYRIHNSDLIIDLTKKHIEVLDSEVEPWNISLIDTGEATMTGGRIKRIQNLVKDETFMLTYGDGVGNINVSELLNFHKNHGKALTVTAIQPSGRFGALDLAEDGLVQSFLEKPKGDGAWINGGYMVCEPEIFNYIEDNDSAIFEQEPMQKMAFNHQISAYKHYGFWRPMDTLKDKQDLNKMWNENNALWKIW